MRQTTTTSTAQRIRDKYGSNRGASRYSDIAREFGVSRQLVQVVLTTPSPPRAPRARRRRTGGMRSLVVRVPSEDLNDLRIIANSRSQTISALLCEILIAYCRQLR